MDFDSLLELTGKQPSFELALLVQAFGGSREGIRVQLSRWMKQGRVIGLRRGHYALAERYRRVPVTGGAMAGTLYRPSYLSGLWALGFHDLIPERVVRFTSVSPRPPQTFENPFGVFEYRNIKQQCFFGYQRVAQGGGWIFVAEPEKALLDHWHLTPGEWDGERLEEMRYQHFERVDGGRLLAYAKRFQSPRLARAATCWLRLADDAEKGTITL
jgi:predicted transcriptional regulator of viral defense system